MITFLVINLLRNSSYFIKVAIDKSCV
jgi:hypothetical protein